MTRRARPIPQPPQTAPGRQAGRPSTFDQTRFNTICKRLADGESLRAICRDDDMPSETTVRGWVLDDVAGISSQYVRARQLQAERWAEEILEIANTPEEGIKTKIKEDGSSEETRGDMIEHRRLKVDTRKWMLSKVLPKVYGDKLELSGTVDVALGDRLSKARKRAQGDP